MSTLEIKQMPFEVKDAIEKANEAAAERYRVRFESCVGKLIFRIGAIDEQIAELNAEKDAIKQAIRNLDYNKPMKVEI